MSTFKDAGGEGSRREFLRRGVWTAVTAAVLPAARGAGSAPAAALPGLPFQLEITKLAGKPAREDKPAPFPGGQWWTAGAVGDGFECLFPPGSLAGARILTADLLVDGNHMAVFQLTLQEGESGPAFTLVYTALNQCQARLRMQTIAVEQNQWRFPREGAWLKPMCGGQRVDLKRVDRLILRVLRKSDQPVSWYMTPITATAEDVAQLSAPILPKGFLLDEFGQSRIHEWPARSRTRDEVTARLKTQAGEAPGRRWPSGFSRWGGCQSVKFEGQGYFRTHHDGKRWWLLDPDGCAFWSAGMDCVRVDTAAAYRGLEKALAWIPPKDGSFTGAFIDRDGERTAINYLAANFIHAFGPDAWYEKWSAIALGELRHLGFNTVANWSDWKIASTARFPYVRPLDYGFRQTPKVYRDMPDVFHPLFETEASSFARQLDETKTDPAFIGYFLMNEPTWGFASETPAAGMLFTTESCASRTKLREWLSRKYQGDAALAAAWGIPASFSAVEKGRWSNRLTPAAQKDLADFSAIMVSRFFGTLTDACRKVDPNHLNLGIRYHTVPPPWAVEGMRKFDVFSMNCYESRVRSGEMEKIAAMLKMPVMVGEWHFGALDVGLPASGIGHVRNQEARGKAFRVYTEDAAAKPWCVGVHYFTLYDQSALGRFDGENYNIGFLDVCNRPYEALCSAARLSHERLYDVTLGKVAPYADAPEYLPKLFV